MNSMDNSIQMLQWTVMFWVQFMDFMLDFSFYIRLYTLQQKVIILTKSGVFFVRFMITGL